MIYSNELDPKKHFPSLFKLLRDKLAPDIATGLKNDVCTKKLLQDIAIELFRAVGKVKHWGFKEEQEYRIIAGMAKSTRSDDTHQKNEYHRRGRCGSIPYIKLFEENDDLPISGILIGPSKNQEASALKVKTMLGNMKLKGKIRLEKSEIPFVGTV